VASDASSERPRLHFSSRSSSVALRSCSSSRASGGAPQITLNPIERSARVVTQDGGAKILEFAGKNRRWAFLRVFADRAVPPGSRLKAEALYMALNPEAGHLDDRAWNALRGLVHELNSSARSVFGDDAPRIFQSSARGEKTVTVLARCSLERLAGDEPAVAADPTGISEGTGEGY
jgi:hypothetical protein